MASDFDHEADVRINYNDNNIYLAFDLGVC